MATTEAGIPLAAGSRPKLPSTFDHSNPAPVLHYQGAEALLYRSTFLGKPAALKHRPSKPYRHPILDAKLTRHRILAEARVLVKLRREGVPVPAVYALDWDNGWMMGEWIDGRTVRSILDERLPGFVLEGSEDEDAARVEETAEDLKALMRTVGAAAGKMHQAGVVHGDLTTSNILVRSSNNEIIIIDFGLAEQSAQVEDRAVDLYVLERAFGSTHPRTEKLFGECLDAYAQSYKAAPAVLKRFEEVRLRGRKKIMIG